MIICRPTFPGAGRLRQQHAGEAASFPPAAAAVTGPAI